MLEIAQGGELIITECEFEGSPISFRESARRKDGQLTIDICSKDAPVDLAGLANIASAPDTVPTTFGV